MRPPVTVVVPFRGNDADARRLQEGLRLLRLREGDEVIVADNTDSGTDPIDGPATNVVRATGVRSAYHARNAGARAARNDWLLFMDADCTPDGDLLDAFLARPIAERCGAVSGAIHSHPDQQTVAACYVRSRKFFNASDGLLGADATQTGNLLVRRAAFEEVGGFARGIRSGGDLDLSRRVRAAGWTVEHRPEARVRHLHRESLIDLLRTIARYGAGARWLNERYPGSSPSWPLVSGLRGAAGDALGLAANGRFEEALFRAIDGLGLVAHRLGYATSNAAPRL
jgi:cellulose synthase/poly-beta-1,6-N-acetylglucosamine synthase-like glycosyltransferase